MLLKAKKPVYMMILCLALVVSMPADDALGDVRVTVTFAAGGVACGFYLFVHLSSGYISEMHDDRERTTALFNLDREGWHIKMPALKHAGDGRNGYTPYIDIFQLRF